ncbi:UbiD family decarboxylase [Ochrobactrum sp. CM-21-5]|nr:UbiD family decarboxylase [Ochrobactrum sp. CM-21-5]MBC2886365.1 UbiD family decarboxylase [Ochrobactrum sp. CM-21-5]
MKSGSCLPTHYDCLQSFMTELEKRGDLVRIMRPVSLVHEITEIHRRVLEADGPALLFQNPVDANGHLHAMPLLANLFGSQRRIAWGLGRSLEELPLLAQMLAELRAPTPPRSAGEIWEKLPIAKAALHMRPRRISRAPIHHNVFEGQAVNLDALPIQWCWPGEPAPLITWPLVITRAPDDPSDINVGIYRMQKLGSDRLIMRWLAQRGGARHHRMWQQRGEDMPVAVVIGADPATILAAVMPLPEGMSELAFSGLLGGRRLPVTQARTVPLAVPANAEIVLEGRVSSFETALEGPYGDHTGYYNSVEEFPVMQVTAITMRKTPVYLSTYTGRPPDEPSRLGEVMNQLFVPVVRKQFPEIADLWLPPAACSYRAMVVSIDKRYPGQARRVMMGLWSMLPQFSYTKLIIAVDPDIDVRNWDDVMWALSTRFDASRDVVTIPGTPVDYLDFASPRSGLGGKLGLDATNKIDPETDREWGTVLAMNEETIARVDAIWDDLGLDRKKQT